MNWSAAGGTTVQLDEFVAELGKPPAASKLDEIMTWASKQFGVERDSRMTCRFWNSSFLE